MSTLHLNLNDNKDVKRVVKAAYPAYNGRKISVRFNIDKMNVRSYWDGGRKTTYTVVGLTDDLPAKRLPDSHPMFNSVDFDPDNFVIPQNCVVVALNQGGYGESIVVYTAASPLLETGEKQLTETEVQVLLATRGLKSSYAGISDYRKHEIMRVLHITGEEVDAIRKVLRERGYLHKNNAISNKGKNAVAGKFWR